MSSHHIVREAQEPALIIANGELCSSDLLSQLLEWSPFIVVLDGALQRVLDLQIKFDVLLGDFDNQTIEEIQLILPPHSEIIHTPNQNKTDLEKGLDYLIQKNHKAVNIVWATGRRSDHYLNNISILARYTHALNIVMLDDYSRIYPIKSGFKKHYSANTNISLMPLGKVENLTTDNLVWECQNLNIEFPKSSSSCNRVRKDGIVTVTFDSGILLMMECIDL